MTVDGVGWGGVGGARGGSVTGLRSDVTACWLWKRPGAFQCRFCKEEAVIDRELTVQSTQGISITQAGNCGWFVAQNT